MAKTLREAVCDVVRTVWKDAYPETMSDECLASNLAEIKKGLDVLCRKTALGISDPHDLEEIVMIVRVHGAKGKCAEVRVPNGNAMAAVRRLAERLNVLPAWQTPTPEHVDAWILAPLPTPAPPTVEPVEGQYVDVFGAGRYFVLTLDGKPCAEMVQRALEENERHPYRHPRAKAHARHVLASLSGHDDPPNLDSACAVCGYEPWRLYGYSREDCLHFKPQAA